MTCGSILWIRTAAHTNLGRKFLKAPSWPNLILNLVEMPDIFWRWVYEDRMFPIALAVK